MKLLGGVIPYNCKRCDLNLQRKSIVWGDGWYDAPIAFIGEAPGASEDEKGIAFCGASGRLLRNLIKSIGVNKYLFINIVKCRPPANRVPAPEEVRACRPYFELQLRKLNKNVVLVALGATAWLGLTGEICKVTKQRGMISRTHFNVRNKAILTYHPSYILRNNVTEIKTNFLRDVQTAIKGGIRL